MANLPAKKVVVLRPVHTNNRRSLLRLIPAALASAGFHIFLFGLLFLLSNPTQADAPPTEPSVRELVVDSESEEPVTKSEFLADEVNPFSDEPDLNPNNDSLLKADITIFGLTDPRKEVGVQGDEKGPPVTLPPNGAFNGIGDGGAVVVDKGGDRPKTLTPGGPPFRGPWRVGTLDARGSAATREYQVRVGGGTTASEAAVTRGLHWIVRNQSPDGKWMLDGNFKDRGTANDIAGTAFGLLPLLGAGKTHKAGKDNPYDKPIEKALLYLIRKQDKKTGDFGGGMYAHGLATIAMCEAYALTQDQSLRRPAQNAVGYIIRAQHDGGGWRYTPGQAGDTSVTGWQIMALKSAMMAGLDVPAVSLTKAQRYLDSVCDKNNEGYGYTAPGSTPTMSAVGLLGRQYLQSWGPKNPRLIKGIDANLRPVQPGAERNIYYYYYATQVMHHFGGEAWTEWNTRMREQLIKTQDVSGNANDGSWSSEGDAQTAAGGRLMMTSMAICTLEIYYRYLPLYQREAAANKDMAQK